MATLGRVTDRKTPAPIVDADYEVVGDGYRVGEEHRTEKGWYFTGHRDADGDPIFMRHPNWFRWHAFRKSDWWPLAVIGVAGAIPLVLIAVSYAVHGAGVLLGFWPPLNPAH